MNMVFKKFKKIALLYCRIVMLSGLLVVGVVYLFIDLRLLANQVHLKTPTSNQQVEDMKSNIMETYLENGLKIILKEDHSLPLVTVGCWYRVGSKEADVRSTGISHFVEHLTFKGSEQFEQLFPNNKQGVSTYSVGNPNAYTFLDQTGYFSTILSSGLERVLKLEAYRMQIGGFNNSQINDERRFVLSELRARDQNSRSVLDQNVVAAAFKLHPYRWPILGWSQDVQQLDAVRISKHYLNYYSPNNAILVVVGDFQTDDILSLINRFFWTNF